MSDFIHRPQIEVLSAADGVRRRQWSEEDKLRIVEESFVGHRQVSATARRHGMCRSLLTIWHRQYRSGELGASRPVQLFGDIAELADPQDFAHLLTTASRRDWVVYAKPPFGGPEQVLTYLSRYTHRVAIANSRLISMEDGKVTFHWRDYRHGRRPRRMTLEAGEFIRRFLLHTLPDGFHRIRHYGFLANGQRVARLAACRVMLAAHTPETEVRAEPVAKGVPTPRPCPCCGRPMVTIAVWYHGQAPPDGPFWNDRS